MISISNAMDSLPTSTDTQPIIRRPPNNDFYMSETEENKIMDPGCFSPEISQFLSEEKSYLSSYFNQESYDCIVEVGCHAGHNTEWLSSLCDYYIGIDVNENAIAQANRTFQFRKNIEFRCASVEALRPMLLTNVSRKKRLIVLFPFNLFGNFINITKLIEMLDVSGVDLAMCNFNTKAATTIGRYKYYLNCFKGVGIRVFDAEQGVLFKAGQNFRSIAFNREYLTRKIQEVSEFHGIVTSFSVFGDLYLLTK